MTTDEKGASAPVKPRALSTIAEDASALAEEVAHRATIRRGPDAAEDAVKLQIAARLIAEVANAPRRLLDPASRTLRALRGLQSGQMVTAADVQSAGPPPVLAAHCADMARLRGIVAAAPAGLDAQQTAEVRAIVARMFAPEASADGAGAAYRSRIALYRATAEGEPKAGSDALDAMWMQADAVAQAGGLSDLDTRPALLAWARGAGSGTAQPPAVSTPRADTDWPEPGPDATAAEWEVWNAREMGR